MTAAADEKAVVSDCDEVRVERAWDELAVDTDWDRAVRAAAEEDCDEEIPARAWDELAEDTNRDEDTERADCETVSACDVEEEPPTEVVDCSAAADVVCDTACDWVEEDTDDD